MTPNYSFLKNNDRVDSVELSVGSVNNFNKMYSILIDIKDSYVTILKNSRVNVQSQMNITRLNMKYWAREINPDFISEAKHTKLGGSLKIDDSYKNYPLCVKSLTGLKRKGNLNRYLLLRFLLSVHKPRDAKFIYYSVLSDKERDHAQNGDRKSTRLNSSHTDISRMPSSA